MIAFEYRPVTSLKEGFDAIAEWQRMKFQKAVTNIQLGSQFGDPAALEAGFRSLGLDNVADKFAQIKSGQGLQKGFEELSGVPEMDEAAAKAKQAAHEKGLSIAGEAGWRYLHPEADIKEQTYQEYLKKAKLIDANKAKYKTVTERDKAKELLWDSLTKAEKQKIDASSTVESKPEAVIDKVLTKETVDEFKKINQVAEQLEDVSKRTKEDIQQALKEKKFEKVFASLPAKALSNSDNLNKLQTFILNQPDEVTSRKALNSLAKAIIDRKGGFDPSDVAFFSGVEEALARQYGRDEKSQANWALYLKRVGGQAGGGTKTKDYFAYIKGKRDVIPLEARSAEEAYKKALAKGLKPESFYITKYDKFGVAKAVTDMLESATKNKAALEMYGMGYRPEDEAKAPILSGLMTLFGSQKKDWYNVSGFYDLETGETIDPFDRIVEKQLAETVDVSKFKGLTKSKK